MGSKAQMSARDRIVTLLDETALLRLALKLLKRSTDFNMSEVKAPSDGVITGFGVVNGNPVYVYSQDATVLGGSIGEMHARKLPAFMTLQ